MAKDMLVQTVCEAFDTIPLMRRGYREAMRSDEIAVTDWNTNPLFLGSYGAMKVGHARQGPKLSQRGHIIFAGTEFHPVAGGSMATAHESGLIAVRMVLAPQSRPELHAGRRDAQPIDLAASAPSFG